jgi:thioredoxin-related protein
MTAIANNLLKLFRTSLMYNFIMRVIKLLFLGVVCITPCCYPILSYCQLQGTAGINFESGLSWDQIKEKAATQHKYIFLDCYTTWCGPCKKMDKDVYSNNKVGSFMRTNFISWKIQMDSTVKDNPEVVKSRLDAQEIRDAFNVDAYPTFLFFSPEGKLMYKDVGFKNVEEFIIVADQALDPKNEIYYSKLQAYKQGKREKEDLYELAQYANSIGETVLAWQIANEYLYELDRNSLVSRDKILFVLNVAANRPLADSLANSYKINCLNKLPDSAWLAPENLQFINSFPSITNSSDKLFHFCYNRAWLVDSVIGYHGWSKKLVDSTITREDVHLKVFKDGRFLKSPNWIDIKSNIRRKYPKVDAERIVLDYQVEYFKRNKDWSSYNAALIQRVEKYGPFGMIDDQDFNLNNHAWELFLHSNKRRDLLTALEWSEKAIELVKTAPSQYNLPNWMDTKANILYKLGKVSEAMSLERRVTELDNSNEEFQKTLHKMQTNEPTW